MSYTDVPHLLQEMYEEALEQSKTEENERYKLALLGLVNAFRTDLERRADLIPKRRDQSVKLSPLNQ